MRIQAPMDYDLDENFGSASQFSQPVKIPDLSIEKQSKRKPRIQLKKLNSRKDAIENRNHFHQMYKETKKKLLVNMFINKLRQIIISTTAFSHHLLSDQQDQDNKLIRKIRIPLKLEVLLSVIFIIYSWIFSILITLEVSLTDLSTEMPVSYFFLIPVIGLGMEACCNILVDPQIISIKDRRNSEFVKDSVHIYARGWMVIDIVLGLIFIGGILVDHPILIYSKLLFLVKLLLAKQKLRDLEIYYIENNFKMQYWQLVKVFLFNFSFGHFLAIALVLMAHGQTNWITQSNLNPQSWFQVYVWAYYWATNIMLTVGFGDISATNVHEALVMIFIETLSCIVLAYNINKVGQIIQKITSYEGEKLEDLKIFNHLQNREGVSNETKKKITNFITETAELKKKFNVQEEESLLLKLPKSIYDQYKQESNTKIFLSLPFFRCLNLRKLQQISMKIQKKLAHPEQILIEYNTIPNITIINCGNLGYMMHRIGLKNHGKQVQNIKVKQNQYKLISQYFFNNQVVSYDVKCKDYSIVFSMNTEELKSILSSSPYCHESYCMKRDADRYNPNDFQVQICTLCSNNIKKSFHTLFDCPKMHYIPLKQHVIEKFVKTKKYNNQRNLSNQYKRIQRPNISPIKLFSETKDFLSSYFKIQFQNGKGKIRFINTTEEKGLNQEQLCIDDDLNSMKFQSLFKYRCLQSMNSENKLLQKDEIKKICQQVTMKLKEELSKNESTANREMRQYFWDVECDQGYDFSHYFKKENPSMIEKSHQKKKMAIIKKIFKFSELKKFE